MDQNGRFLRSLSFDLWAIEVAETGENANFDRAYNQN